MEEKNYFKELNAINVNEHVEKKGNLSYLSWAWAWTKVKEHFPNATFKVYENSLPNGYVVNYFTDGKYAYVKTGVTINDIEHIEYLPVMDNRNKSIPLENITSFEVNTAIQRSLTKACARHGLGLYIYAGEDLPYDEQEQESKPSQTATKSSANSKVDTKSNYGKTHEELVKSVTTQFDRLDNDKKTRWTNWLKQQGFGEFADFTKLPDSVLACMDKNLSR